MNAYKNASYVGFVIMIFGLIIAGYGFSFLLELRNLDSNGVKVKGTVVDINENAIYRSPYVKFTTLEGREITFLSELEVNKDMFSYYVGQEVNVIYNKENPTDAKIDAFWERNFPQLFLGCFGVVLLFIGFLIRRIMLGKAKRFDESQRNYR